MSDQIKQNIEKLKNMTPAEWDSVCRGCGICCIPKFPDSSGTIVYKKFRCEYFDIKTKMCKCFEKRLCLGFCKELTLENLFEQKVPDSCAYMEFIYGPAKHTADVDWFELTLITDENAGSMEHSDKIIPGSHLWTTKRERQCELKKCPYKK